MPRMPASFAAVTIGCCPASPRMAEEGGLRIIGLEDVAPEIFVPEGALGRYEPSPRDRTDIARALKLIAALGPFDVGQAAVVADNHVLAVEAAEGTDNMLARIAELRAAGPGHHAARRRRSGQGAKTRPGSPLRSAFDRAADHRGCRRAPGLPASLSPPAATIVAEAAEVIAAADREKIFVAGVAEDAAR